MYSASITLDFHIQADSSEGAKAKLKKIAEQLESGESIDAFSELGLIEQPEVSSMSYIP